MAGLTGALRLLTGLGWPMIYFVAAMFHRRKYGRPLKAIHLEEEHAVEVVGLLAPLLYFFIVWWKASLELIDAVLLVAIYVAYLLVLRRIPPEEAEGIEDLGADPADGRDRDAGARVASIFALFAAGGRSSTSWLSRSSAACFHSRRRSDPELCVHPVGGAVRLRVPREGVRLLLGSNGRRAPIALMNMVSSNINQWTLLAAMLPIVYSISAGTPSSIPFDERQRLEILMTLGQSLVGMLFLINMELIWWKRLSCLGCFSFSSRFR